MDASPIRRAVQLGLCLMLFAGLAVGCGGSKSSTQTAQLSLSLPSPSPKASASPMPSPTLDLNAFESDGGAFGTNGPALEDAGYTDRYPDLEGLDHMKEAYTIIVNGLPKAVDLNQVKTEAPGMISSDAYVNWQPMGRRDTVLPPGNHGERIYELDVDLGSYVKGGDAVAHVWFITRAQGDALDPVHLTATPNPYPSQAFTFKLDSGTAAALLNLFWVKGAAPTESPTD